MKNKQIKVTVDENLYKLLCKKSLEELGEVNLSLFTRALYHRQLASELFKMQTLRSKGLTYAEIGEIFGMSRQAVHQKLKGE
mgnify:FL=1